MNSISLDRKEIEEITNKKRFTAQIKQLHKMGIDCIQRGDGFPIVSREHFLQITGANTSNTTNKVRLNL